MKANSDLPRPTWLNFAALSGLILLAWTFFGLIASLQMLINTEDMRSSFPLSRVLHLSLGNSLLKGVLLLPFIWIFNRVVKRRVVTYLFLMPVFAVIHAAVRPFFIPFVLNGPSPPGVEITYRFMFVTALRSFFVDNALAFFGVVLAFHLWQYAHQARERALNETKLQARLASAELQVLKMQLQPHFLFNTLNTIYNLVPINGGEAQRMIARLSHLLRFSLDHVATETVPLHHELNFLMEYIDIEKVRFEERLCVQKDVSPDTLQAEVPNMILQPLVENAIRHGIGKKAAGGSITIWARRSNGRLAINVVDDGAPPAASNGNGSGIGLANTRARLTKLYGEDFSFRIEAYGQGTRVSLSIPFRESAN